ncbi:MAG: hypothetical protein EOO28_02115 [Comamonadaceae bacterium]|nr:MAG: hypothetical protein EOO28_02115 [Comamonadaceae bacterium]
MNASFKPAGARDWCVLALVFAGFLVAAIRISGAPPAADFAVAAHSQVAPEPAPLAPGGKLRADAGFVSSTPGQAVHAASAVALKDGSLRAVWFSGSREGAGDVAIRTAVMNAATFEWGTESTIIERKRLEQGLWRYVKKIGNPVIARAPDGSLYIWLVNVSLGGWAGSAITWIRSTDDGVTWGQPRRLVTSPFINISTLVKGGPVAYADGTIGLPVYHEFITKFAEILRIDRNGRVIDKTRIPGSQASLQPVVLVENAQKARVYMRSGNATAVMASETVDAGRTWSTTAGIGWPNPDSALAGVVTSSGTQWLALNPNERTRETLSLLKAGPDGRFDGANPLVVESSPTPSRRATVAEYEAILGKELQASGSNPAQIQAYIDSAKRQLCNGENCAQEFSYPYLIQGPDGHLHLFYTWHRARIKHVRIDPLKPVLQVSVPQP